MKETFENEMKKWKEDYIKAEKNLLKKYPLNDNLSNRHPINKLQKVYWQKKILIYKKYNKINNI